MTLISTLVLLASCNQEMKFDKAKWNEQQDPAFPPKYRKQMLTDLTTHYPLKGMHYSDLIQLLGDPDLRDSSAVGYKIVTEYGHAIDPIYTRTLDFTLSPDSVVTAFEVLEWKRSSGPSTAPHIQSHPEDSEPTPSPAASTLSGYWIPEKISWKSPHSGNPDIDSVVRSAYFKVLCFDSAHRFSTFATTINYPRRYDSLIFEYEPGVDVSGGIWNEQDQGKVTVNYRLLYSGYEKQANAPMMVDTLQTGPASSLLFEKVPYVKTTRFDAASLRKIAAYRSEAGVSSNPAAKQENSFTPDTAVNTLKLADSRNTEKLFGAIWDKMSFEADGQPPRLEIVNRDSTQVLRLMVNYGGSKDAADQFEVLAVDKHYKFPRKLLRMNIDTFRTSRKITLLLPKDSVVSILGKKYTSSVDKKGNEELFYELDESNSFVKRYNQWKYFIECSFRNGVLLDYSFGFEYP